MRKSVHHGGKARAEAVSRILRTRFSLWRAGRFAELWERMCQDHAHRTKVQQKREDDELQREARRVAQLVDQGLLSRAASQLCSRGIAPNSPTTVQKVEALFPEGSLPLETGGYEAPAFELQPADVKKAILRSPRGWLQAVWYFVPNTLRRCCKTAMLGARHKLWRL